MKYLDKINIIDIEATCWESGIPPKGIYSDIIEIGICELDTKTLERSNKRSLIVIPTTSEITKFCTELTTINKELIDSEGILLQEALEIIKKDYLIKDRAWASWGAYDREQFEGQCRRENIEYPFSNTHYNLDNLFALKNKLNVEIEMDQAMEYLHLSLEGIHHRGADDAWNIALIMKSLLI